MKQISFISIIYRIISTVIKSSPLAAIVHFIYRLVNMFMPAAITYITINLLDNAYLIISQQADVQDLFRYGFMFMGIYVISDFMTVLNSVTENVGIFEKSLNNMKSQFFTKFQKIPLIAFEKAEFYNKKIRAEQFLQNEVLAETFVQLTNCMSLAISFIILTFVLASYSAWLIPLSVVSAVPYLVARILRGKEFFRLRQFQAPKARSLAYLWNLFCNKNSIKEMRVMGFYQYIANKWSATRDSINEETWKLQFKDNKSLFFCNSFRIICYGLSVMLILYLVFLGSVTIGVFGACLNAFNNLQNSTRAFFINIGQMSERLLDAKVYYEFLEIEEDIDGTDLQVELNIGIDIQDISFRYPNAQEDALNSINIDISKNETIVILGENGSGKTTLSKLIIGAYLSDKGTIRYDGKDIIQLSKKEVFKIISIVSQNFVRYNMSVRENIAISDINTINDSHKINDLLENLEIKDIVNEVGGLDTMLGREFGGIEFSGGQWQKIAIARGIFRNSPFIILDEPTSALDPLKEYEILNKFLDISKDKTSIIISHRVGLCKYVDKIIVMKKGKIVEIGSHKELLMKQNGLYRMMYEAQKVWYD